MKTLDPQALVDRTKADESVRTIKDAAALVGYSYQRLHQVAQENPEYAKALKEAIRIIKHRRWHVMSDKDLMQMLANGYIYTDISSATGYSSRSISLRLDELRVRWGAENNAELVAMGFRNRMIK